MQIRAHRTETGWKYQTGRDTYRDTIETIAFSTPRAFSPRRVAPRRFSANGEEVEGKGDPGVWTG
jgi:hypothetical protein